MSQITKVYRSTPLDDVEALYEMYGTRDRAQIPFLTKLDEASRVMQELLTRSRYRHYGVVFAIEGTWGSGKTSFVSLLMNELGESNIACIKFDSLFYGSVSEASEIFIGNLFEEIKEVFGISLKNGNVLSDNLSPRLELSNGFPRFSLDFIKKRKSVEVVKEQLSDKLTQIPGKVVVVIDDLDRVASKDIVHFLRIVRVLRELPNFIIILPIDRRAIENLLGKEVEYPSRYLHKLIDHSISLNADVATARTIYNNQIADRRKSGLTIDDSIVDTCWEMILWAIVIDSLDSDSVRETGIVIGSDKNDMNWSNLERKLFSQQAGTNIVRAVFQKLLTDYGGTDNYVTRISNNQANPQPYEDISYRNLRNILNQSNLANILLGRAIPSISPNEHLQNDQVIDVMTTRWWKDTVSMIHSPYNTNPGNVAQDYNFRVQNQDINTFNQQMNESAITIWDEIHEMASIYFPYESIPHLAPRSMFKICANLDFEYIANLGLNSTSHSEDRKPLYDYIRSNVRETINQA